LELYKVMATVIGCFRIEAVGTPKSKQVWVRVVMREKQGAEA
jgi:hypothetical protein